MIRKIVLAITSLAVTAGVVVNPLPAAAEEKSSEPWILSMMHSVDYEDKSIGDTIYKGSYYNMTVQADPSDPSNKCSKEVATEHDTQGFGPTYDINPAVTSETPFIIEEDVMFSTQQWMEYQMYLRCVDGENGHGYGINLWSINTWDIFGITPEQNKWYKIIFMIDGPRSQYTVYIKDSKDN